MKLQFLGTGGAFSRSRTNYHNNAMLTIGGDKYLLDCSLLALESLDEIGVDPLEIEGVILTHMHGDHDSGLEELGFRGLFLGPNQRFELYVHEDIVPNQTGSENSEAPDLWENRLRGGMEHIQDQEGNPVKADMDTYFDVRAGSAFRIGDCSFEFVQTEHVPGKKSFGLKGNTPGTDFFFTADARPMFFHKPDLYVDADVIFHDCMFMPHYPATVHTHLEELLEMPEQIQEKTWIMHYGDASEWDNHDTGLLNIARQHQIFNFA